MAGDFYEEHAQDYADKNETAPYNALYERPASLALLGDVRGKRVLDAGCGPGAHALGLLERGAIVTGCDRSEPELAIAGERLGPGVQLDRVDLATSLPYASGRFDAVLCSLVLHYLEDWSTPLREFHRVLRPEGRLVVSTHHPIADYGLSGTDDYFATELWHDTWTVGGRPVPTSYYRRPLAAMTDAFLDAGFSIERVTEPAPATAMRTRFPEAFRRLSTAPAFLFFRLRPAGLEGACRRT
ncbi:MAG: methyltransferase domain-containing protein [Candidatus Dormibacteraceae bacterium]